MTFGILLTAMIVQGVALSLIMSAAWVVQQRTGNSGWIDAVWTFGLGAVGVASALVPVNPGDWPTQHQILVAALITIWALRLGSHILRRSAHKADDPRYGELIRGWGVDAGRQMFILLQKQALVSIPLSLSLFSAAQNPEPGIGSQEALAVCIFVTAVLGEAIADRQLRTFASKPPNKARVCDVGLWRWSRHPNYFFEWLHWLTYPAIGISLTGAYPIGWVSLAAPLCMYWLLTRVSGVPPLELHMVRRHGAAYRAYQARTNAFFPGPPKNA